MQMDPRCVQFIQWLSGQTGAGGAVGAVAQHVAANAYLPSVPSVIDQSGNFQPAVKQINWPGGLTEVGMTMLSPLKSWATAPPDEAAQALRYQNFDVLTVSINHYGPNTTQTQVATALATWGG
jgi:hypothetical protein